MKPSLLQRYSRRNRKKTATVRPAIAFFAMSTDLPNSTGFGSSSLLMPRTTNSLGAESMTPEGDIERGMCSMEKRVGTTGTDRPTRRKPREPCKVDQNLKFANFQLFVYFYQP